MKKKFNLFVFYFIISGFCFAQDKTTNESSKTRKFIEDASTIRINKDWSLIAEFKSGIGETVAFFPIQVVDLKTGLKKNSLQIDMQIKNNNPGFGAALLGGVPIAGAATASAASIATNTMIAQAMLRDGIVSLYVDNNQVDEFIQFIEQNIIAKLSTTYKDKSSEFIFTADEITFKFLIFEKKKRLSIILNNAQNYEFWTESRAENIGELIPILKKVNSKELKFD